MLFIIIFLLVPFSLHLASQKTSMQFFSLCFKLQVIWYKDLSCLWSFKREKEKDRERKRTRRRRKRSRTWTTRTFRYQIGVSCVFSWQFHVFKDYYYNVIIILLVRRSRTTTHALLPLFNCPSNSKHSKGESYDFEPTQLDNFHFFLFIPLNH
jgi:hypothetical protein